MKTLFFSKFYKAILFLLVASFLFGCAPIRRNPIVPPNLIYRAQIPNMPNVRVVVNHIEFKKAFNFFAPARTELKKKLDSGQPANILSVSGGGANGAFGAGVLYGWSKAGTRPKFDIVTGVSTGAFIGMFAFLGPAYDEQMKEAYTTVSDKNVFVFKKLMLLFTLRSRQSVASTEPFREMIMRYVTPEAVKRVAEEYAKGRIFYVATVQLDAKRVVIWDMGAIASYGTPQSLQLFRKVMLASAAIPVVFPPVHFTVTADGKSYDELHVDGGAGVQLFGDFYTKDMVKNSPKGKGHANIYIIRNGKLAVDPNRVDEGLLGISRGSLEMITNNQAVNDAIRIYALTQNQGVNYNFAFIPQDFYQAKRGEFDPYYMRSLFDVGRKEVLAGHLWKSNPYVLDELGW